ncbi:hypothetical protein B0H63DRAFT_451144 [Podospora didyma]|uniref:Fungal N-terminal domain-containing protein n=1 Tax=Podospora didyma TaxID=330526 RepID=A0AAE0NI11_9PEZI|nr:hypothetical protein B0H63DRAFT_451144 [Podospora didyma]
MSTSGLPSCGANRQVLQRARVYFRDVIAVLANRQRLGWPECASAEGREHVDGLVACAADNFRFLDERAVFLAAMCGKSMAVEMNVISTAEARKSLQQSRRMELLTTLAFVVRVLVKGPSHSASDFVTQKGSQVLHVDSAQLTYAPIHGPSQHRYQIAATSDPLSIATAVVGLVATAGKICLALSTFVSSAIDAPQSARDALAAVEDVRLALDLAKGLVDTVTNLPSNRRMLARLNHIAITFSNCVFTLSELESLICYKDSIMHRMRWAWCEKKILRLLPRLDSQKASLSLMVTVLMCQSEMEALAGRDRLNAAVEQILQRDEEFAARVRNLDEMHVAENQSTVRDDGAGIRGPFGLRFVDQRYAVFGV